MAFLNVICDSLFPAPSTLVSFQTYCRGEISHTQERKRPDIIVAQALRIRQMKQGRHPSRLLGKRCRGVGRAADNGQFPFPGIDHAASVSTRGWLRRGHSQTLAEQLSHEFFHSPALYHRAKFHFTQHIVGQINGCFHTASVLACWLAVNGGCWSVVHFGKVARAGAHL